MIINNNNRKQVRKHFEESTKNMSLKDKLKWIEDIIFDIELADIIQDLESWNEYYEIKYELIKTIKNKEVKNET